MKLFIFHSAIYFLLLDWWMETFSDNLICALNLLIRVEWIIIIFLCFWWQRPKCDSMTDKGFPDLNINQWDCRVNSDGPITGLEIDRSQMTCNSSSGAWVAVILDKYQILSLISSPLLYIWIMHLLKNYLKMFNLFRCDAFLLFFNILCLNSWIRKDGQTGRQRNICNPWEKFISDVHFLLNTSY